MLRPSRQCYSSRVFWAVMTMQPGMTRIFNGIPSVNPASVSHAPCNDTT
ncbi:hypothetical protein V6P92_15925 [Dickeya ananatis]